MAQTVAFNGSASQKVAQELQEEAVSENENHWDWHATFALIADFITIACIAWLLLR